MGEKERAGEDDRDVYEEMILDQSEAKVR